MRVTQSEKKKNSCIKNSASGPCIICKQRLSYLGFGKIAFSNERGEIEIHKLKDYKRVHVVNNHRKYLKDRGTTDVKIINSSLKCVKLI